MASRSRASSEKIKRLALFGLGLVLVIVVVYKFFLSGPEPKPRRLPQPGTASGPASAPATATGSAAPKSKPMGAAAQQEAMMQALLSDVTPLNLRYASAGGSSAPGKRGNIFAYYVEPPKPPAPPPPPPPIQLTSVQPQSAVAGTPRSVTLVIRGNKIPADALIFVDGSQRPTKRLNENQLSTEISPGDYSLARTIRLQVKSQSDPTQNSNDLQFIVQPTPEPQFIYKGRLGALNQPQSNYALIEMNSNKEIKRIKVGDTIMGIWRVDSISADAIQITAMQYDIKRRVQLQERPK